MSEESEERTPEMQSELEFELAQIRALKEGKKLPNDAKERRRIELTGQYVDDKDQLVTV